MDDKLGRCTTRFIQIAASTNGIYALDTIGGVWLYDETAEEWYQLYDDRMED